MKKLIFILSLFCAFNSVAQEGIIAYTEEVKNPRAEEIRKRMEMRGMKIDIPDVNTSNMLLYFNTNESLYKTKPKKEEEYDGREMGGGRVRFMYFGSSNSANGFYKSLKDGNTLYEDDILNKGFLVSSQLKPIQWKVTGRSENLGQYQVLEAVSINETDTLQAWFTPQIPVSSGPAEFGQLPGMILRMDVNNGKRVIYATNIDLHPLTEEEKIEIPSKGKKVSQEEFEKIRAEKREEMKEMYGEERAKRWMD